MDFQLAFYAHKKEIYFLKSCWNMNLDLETLLSINVQMHRA